MIYFIQDLENKRIKIGVSNDPTNRIKNVLTISSSKKGCVILAVIPGGEKRERQLHNKFIEYHSHREWFNESKELTEFINSHNSQQFNICRICGSLSLTQPNIEDIKGHANIHKMMINGALPFGMRELLKDFGWGILYKKGEPVTFQNIKTDDAKRLIAFSWWARAKQNGLNEKWFEDFMLDQFEYLDAKFDNIGIDFRELSKRNQERWGNFG